MLRKSTYIKIFLALCAASIILLAYAFIEPHLLTIHRIDIHDSDIPENFDGSTIVFVADIHHGSFFGINRVKKMVDAINALEPDMILLGGDYVHRDKVYIEPVFYQLSSLKAKLFTGAVLGNHDHWESKELSEAYREKAGIAALDNRSYWIEAGEQRIKIGGVGDLWEDDILLERTINDVVTDDFVILVSHNPDIFARLNTDKIELVLAGHTHGGQVTFFGLWAPILPVEHKEYWKGLYTEMDTVLYVTSGVGTITPPVRFFSRPEIAVFTLHAKPCP